MIEKTINTFFRHAFFVDIFGVKEKVEITCIVPTIIDEAKIKALREKIEKLNKLILAKEVKLSNDNFLTHAPREIIKKECDALTDLETQRNNEQSLLNQWTDQCTPENSPSESAASSVAASKL